MIEPQHNFVLIRAMLLQSIFAPYLRQSLLYSLQNNFVTVSNRPRWFRGVMCLFFGFESDWAWIFMD